MALPKLDTLEEVKTKTKVKRKDRMKIPKTEMDEETGRPRLAIPNLNDVNLMGEIDKYLGEEE